MRIAYIVEDFSICGGVERIVSQKAGLFASKGHDVTIISVYKDHRPVNYPVDKSVKIVFLDVPMAKKKDNRLITSFNRISVLIKATIKLNKAIKKIKPNVLFFTTTLGALLLPLCRTKATKIYESHLPRLFNPYNNFFSIMERRADMIICLTEGDKMEYRHAKKVEIIPNFIDIPSLSVKDYNVKKAVAVGRLEHQKGFDILIDCWKEVIRVFPDWHLDIYGEGSLKQELQQQINFLGINDNITLCGHCDNMMEKYTEYSLHIMTSRYEGLPMTLIEAQACALPSVVFNFQYGASDFIEDSVNGYLVRQNDRVSLTKQLVYIMNDAALRMKQGKEARHKALKFSKENIMHKWIELLNGLI